MRKRQSKSSSAARGIIGRGRGAGREHAFLTFQALPWSVPGTS